MTSAPQPPIRFVYFDLGNVLLSFDRIVASTNLARLLDRDVHQVDRLLHTTGLQERLEHGHLTPLQYAIEICDALQCHDHLSDASTRLPRVQAIADAISDMFTQIDPMIDIVAAVSDQVPAIGILSNTCHAHWDWISRQAYPLMTRRFDQTVLSFEVGSMKPDAAIYAAAEIAAGCRPDEILFLDDRPENIDAAVSRGWRGEVCLGGTSAAEALRRHSFQIGC